MAPPLNSSASAGGAGDGLLSWAHHLKALVHHLKAWAPHVIALPHHSKTRSGTEKGQQQLLMRRKPLDTKTAPPSALFVELPGTPPPQSTRH